METSMIVFQILQVSIQTSWDSIKSTSQDPIAGITHGDMPETEEVLLDQLTNSDTSQLEGVVDQVGLKAISKQIHFETPEYGENDWTHLIIGWLLVQT